jgi:hypothetical protein
MNKLLIPMIILSAINIGISIITGNIGAICGWLCALIAQSQLLVLGE